MDFSFAELSGEAGKQVNVRTGAVVLSLITLAATVPLLATSSMQLSNQAEKTSQQGEETTKRQKCHLLGRASGRMRDRRKQQLAGKVIALRDGRFILDERKQADDHHLAHHPFTGYFLPFPEKSYDGLVTTINEENFLNWVYIDSSTYQIKHGVRAEAQSQLTGPMNLKSYKNGEQRLTFEGWEGFVVVKEAPGLWALYFDKEDNALRDKVDGKAVVEIELVRMDLDEYHPMEAMHNTEEK
ncbi:hypothetical protein LTR10_021097 [Elasticomyces elasticus]|uniref:Uncharacterized protein n=1 Tax=Exophiala sideris TaxID=1016849 RepID=A0ABR0J6I0_9EURO|nr:hypothetical protein LTR10_021097 [Elasticomyces elasticus]KAK5028894.1 hypothetical protein LTS07_006275 [Exophiala sideris]KAK5035763.1 hypothetical protein LTR13_005894 [Exophiala sideris]KAK5057398.1 hypothetical protein LTR69_007439 [Exophiala sideris]KAK5181626.1 hypothetical protein LTR44_005825 [Eurotiomycetes sp. CCFEE 6388]